jgi:hypothetical protein
MLNPACAAMTFILTWIESLHQTRYGTVAHERRKLLRISAMVPRMTVVAWVGLSFLGGTAFGGVKTAWHYQDAIHASAPAEADGLGG